MAAGDFTIVEGNVISKQEAFSKKDTLAAVGTSPLTLDLTVDVPSGVVDSVSVVRTVGTSNESFTVKIFDDIAKGVDSLIFDATQQNSDRMDFSKSGLVRFKTSDNKLYIELSSATTTGHTFLVRLQGSVTAVLV